MEGKFITLRDCGAKKKPKQVTHANEVVKFACMQMSCVIFERFFYRVITRRSEWNDFRPDGTSQARAAEAKRIGSLVFRRSFAYMQMRPMKNVWNLRRSPAVFCSGHMEMVIYDNFLRFKSSISARNLHMQMRANVKIGRKFLKKFWKKFWKINVWLE